MRLSGLNVIREGTRRGARRRGQGGSTSKVASTEAAIERDVAPGALAGSVTRGRRANWWLRRGSKRRGFRYETAAGERIREEAALERIKSLAVPPAWREVRISPSPRSSLQAIGVDKAGRVQRIYHPSFVARRARSKYEKIERFGASLPALRRRTNEDIAREGLGKERVLAVVVRLINDLYFRVGSETSVRRYRTYGVTTLRNRHLEIKRGGRLVFKFTGKHHIKHRRLLVDEELAALVRDIKAVGGSRLFNYYGEDGRAHAVRPRDVNEYIKAATAPEFSAKDFRTWGGTLLAAVELAETGCCEDEGQAKRNVAAAVRRVAERLGNTPTVCRSCYIHPSVIQAYARGETIEEFRPRRARRIERRQPEYSVEELALLKLLRAHK
ncbi:MAG: DNA topoisomerase I [Acidobacteria bacterium]|nr:MAG: DNA topoisomerase I [Acidobacteriota bacterium]